MTKDVPATMIFAFLTVIAIVIVVVVIYRNTDHSKVPRIFESEKKRAGRRGERIATNIIKEFLQEDDLLFTNVPVSYDGKNTELDNVIVNKYGVFIIEVKYYKGRLYGAEDDYEWEKYKDDGYGNIFEKKVKNPIRQVKRQTYILAKYLEHYGQRVWVEGYAFLVNGNSPISSSYMLESIYDIDKAIHTFGKNRLDAQTVASVAKLLSDD